MKQKTEMINWKRKSEEGGRVLTERQKDGLIYLTFPAFEALPGIRHLFTTREGGISEGCFSSLNLSFTRGDREEAVAENFKRVAEVFNVSPTEIVCSDQTHTTNIRRVTSADKGKGVVKNRDYSDVDGLVTDETGILLATFYADCVPLYFADPIRRVIGLAHSGWRGTVHRIGEKMVQKMEAEYGCKKKIFLRRSDPPSARTVTRFLRTWQYSF